MGDDNWSSKRFLYPIDLTISFSIPYFTHRMCDDAPFHSHDLVPIIVKFKKHWAGIHREQGTVYRDRQMDGYRHRCIDIDRIHALWNNCTYYQVKAWRCLNVLIESKWTMFKAWFTLCESRGVCLIAKRYSLAVVQFTYLSGTFHCRARAHWAPSLSCMVALWHIRTMQGKVAREHKAFLDEPCF